MVAECVIVGLVGFVTGAIDAALIMYGIYGGKTKPKPKPRHAVDEDVTMYVPRRAGW